MQNQASEIWLARDHQRSDKWQDFHNHSLLEPFDIFDKTVW